MTEKKNVYGEGNYKASREYNDATKKFVESGRVDDAARAAAPGSAQEATEMKQAEKAGLDRAKERSKEPNAPVKEPGRKDPAVKDPERDPRLPDDIEATPRKSPGGR